MKAFPVGTGWNHEGNWVGGDEEGMDLRDYFAAKAMPEWIGVYTAEEGAKKAYEWADAMMEARK